VNETGEAENIPICRQKKGIYSTLLAPDAGSALAVASAVAALPVDVVLAVSNTIFDVSVAVDVPVDARDTVADVSVSVDAIDAVATGIVISLVNAL
jgi:hypothetical protein